MPTIIDGSASATFATPLPLSQGGTGNTSGNVASSQVAGALNATGSAPLYACRAWVNFNGTGTVAIRASGNVSSITDDGVGQYRMNFTTAMPDANYSEIISMSGNSDSANTFSTNVTTNSFIPTAAYAVICTKFNGSVYDAAHTMATIFR